MLLQRIETSESVISNGIHLNVLNCLTTPSEAFQIKDRYSIWRRYDRFLWSTSWLNSVGKFYPNPHYYIHIHTTYILHSDRKWKNELWVVEEWEVNMLCDLYIQIRLQSDIIR